MRIAAGLLFAAVALAQNTPSPSVTARGSISGVVRDQSTGTPLGQADVRASRPGAREVVGTADDQGRYTLRGLAPASYRVTATIRRAEGPFGPAVTRPVTLQADEELNGIDLRVPAPSEVSGKVVDENNEPVAGIAVYLVAREFFFGALRTVIAGAAYTDDQGQYSVTRISAGRAYLLVAQNRASRLPAISDAPDDPKLRRRVPQPTYFPDSRTAEGAEAVVVRVGEHRENVNIRLRKAPAYCMEGIVDGPGERSDLRFEIAPRFPTSGQSGNGATFVGAPGGKPGPDGRIRICELPPGDYDLTVIRFSTSGRASQEALGSTLVTIADRDIANARVTAAPQVPVAGEVVWDGAPPEKPIDANLSMDLQSMTRTIYGSAKSTVPGEFSIDGLAPDEYSIRLRGLPSGLYVKDIEYGGHSVRDKGLPVGSTAEAKLRLVVARDGGSVAARVADKDGNPVGNCYVALLPASAGSEAALAAELQSGQTDQNGAWTSPTIPPGKYYVFATEAEIDRSPETIGKLWRMRTRLQEADLGASGTARATLELRALE
jgi:hypothetical protein